MRTLGKSPTPPDGHLRLFDGVFGLAAERDTVRARVVSAWRRTMSRVFPLGGVSHGNQVQLYTDGDAAFEAMLASIDAATSRVWLETYIYEADRVGEAFRSRLIDAAKRGLEVVVVYDHFGSARLPADYFDEAVAHGAEVVAFNPLFLRRLFISSPLNRDHRKILVVDDAVGFAGGMNISEDYAGTRLGNGRFRDSHARVQGPAVRDLAKVFAHSYGRASGKRLRLGPRAPHVEEVSPVLVQVLGSDVRRERKQIGRALRHTVRRSIARCYLTSAYFIPPARLMRAMRLAARRGVDVRVLTAGLSDVPLARWAGWHLYARLLRGGVRVFEMKGRTLHAKTVAIDGVYATVGSFNLDQLSHRRLLEVTVTMLDTGLAEEVERAFLEDLEISEEVTLDDLERRGWLARAFSWFAYQLSRI